MQPLESVLVFFTISPGIVMRVFLFFWRVEMKTLLGCKHNLSISPKQKIQNRLSLPHDRTPIFSTGTPDTTTINNATYNKILLHMKNTGNDVAISEIIGFVLLLALIIAAFALYMVLVVPVNGREDEIRQMNYAGEQFTDYKTAVDALWTSRLINSNGPNPVLNITPMLSSQTMKLGTGGNIRQGGISLVVFKPIASSATISVNTTGDTFSIDSSSYHGSNGDKGEFPLNITALEYRSNNHYWIQQKYSYQLGGVFLSQDEGMINRISPLISLTNADNKSVIVNIVPVRVIGNRSYSTNYVVRVDTRQRIVPDYNISSGMYRDNKWVNMSVTSADNATAAMWLNYFQDLATSEHLDSSAYSTGSGGWSPTLKRTTVFINITGTNPDTTMKRVSLYVQRAEFDVVLNTVASEVT
jgi:hypothetical protein